MGFSTVKKQTIRTFVLIQFNDKQNGFVSDPSVNTNKRNCTKCNKRNRDYTK